MGSFARQAQAAALQSHKKDPIQQRPTKATLYRVSYQHPKWGAVKTL